MCVVPQLPPPMPKKEAQYKERQDGFLLGDYAEQATTEARGGE